MDIIEPKELEKNIIQSMVDELEDATDPDDLRDALSALMEETTFPPPAGEEETFVGDAAAVATATLDSIIDVLRLYIDVHPGFPKLARAEVIEPYLISKAEFEQRNGVDYNNVSDPERADMHLTFCSSLVESTLSWILIKWTMPHATKEEQSKAFDAAVNGDRFCVPFEETPTLLGYVYAHHVFMELIIEHMALLHNQTSQQAKTARAHVHASMVQSLSAEPSEPSDQPQIMAPLHNNWLQ